MMTRRSPFLVAATVATLVLLGGSAEAANGLFPIDYGTKGRGRGGASTGVIGDTSSLNRNPASVAFIVGRQIDSSTEVFIQEVRYESRFEPGSKSDDELVIAPFFGFVFDHPADLLTMPIDVWNLFFGDEPARAERRLFVRSEGWGYAELPPGPLPGSLLVEGAGQGASVSDVQVHAVYRMETVGKGYQRAVEVEDFPRLPSGAVVSGVAAQFDWRYVVRSNDRQMGLKLAVDGHEQNLSFRSTAGGWERASTSVILDQADAPLRVAVLVDPTGNSIELSNLQIVLVYRVGGEYYREVVAERREPFSLGSGLVTATLAREPAGRVVGDAFEPIARFDLSGLPAGAELEKVRVVYRYLFPGGREAVGLLRVRVVADGQVVAQATHSPTEGSPVPTEHVPQELRQAYVERAAVPDGPGFKFGFGLFGQGGSRLNTNVKAELFPEGIDQRVNLLILSIVPAVSYRFNEHFAVGIAPNFNVGQMELDGLVGQSSSLLQGQPLSGITFDAFLQGTTGINEIRGEIDTDFLSSFGVGGQIGFMYRHSEKFSIGAAYVSQTWMQDYEGEASIDFTRFFNSSGLGLPALFFLPNGGVNGLATDVDMTVEDLQLPMQVTVGFAYKPVEWFQLSADARWINWSATFDTIEVKLENSTNPDVNALLGSNSTTAKLPLNWDDQLVFAIGAEFYPTDWLTLRLGWNYGETPVPSSSVSPQFPALNEHHISIGFSIRWPSVELHFAFTHAPKVSVSSSRNTVTSDFNDSETSFELNVVSFGFSLKF